MTEFLFSGELPLLVVRFCFQIVIFLSCFYLEFTPFVVPAWKTVTGTFLKMFFFMFHRRMKTFKDIDLK